MLRWSKEVQGVSAVRVSEGARDSREQVKVGIVVW